MIPRGGTAPFDVLSADYDEQFSDRSIGTLMRAAVWQRMDDVFAPGHVVLELNCGTGEDAAHLAGLGVEVVATDVSREMIGIAREKIAKLGLENMVRFARVDLNEPRFHEVSDIPFDGVISNFGGLNCVSDLRALARSLSSVVKVGGRVIACIMGPVVPWEWGWFLARGQFGKAFRRLRPGGVRWRGLTVRYPSIGSTRRAFRPYFRSCAVTGVGVLIPPPYAEPWAIRHPQLLDRAARWEDHVRGVFPFPWLADHYVLELERGA